MSTHVLTSCLLRTLSKVFHYHHEFVKKALTAAVETPENSPALLRLLLELNFMGLVTDGQTQIGEDPPPLARPVSRDRAERSPRREVTCPRDRNPSGTARFVALCRVGTYSVRRLLCVARLCVERCTCVWPVTAGFHRMHGLIEDLELDVPGAQARLKDLEAEAAILGIPT